MPVNRAFIVSESKIELSTRLAEQNLRMAEIAILIELKGSESERTAI